MMDSIIIAGDGNGILALYRGMQKVTKKIYIFTNQKEIFQTRAEDEFINGFFENDTNLVICAAYAPLIDKETIGKKRFLNVHYAPLPRFRGMHPIVWGILNNEAELGWTLHEIDEFMDSGPIIYQSKVQNDFKSTSIDYMNLFNNSLQEEIGDAVLSYSNGTIKALPQNHELAAWGAKRNLEDCRFNFNFTHDQINLFFRALVKPYPVPFISYKNIKYFITSYKLHNSNIDVLTLGRIVNIDNSGIWVKVKEGYINISALEDEQGNAIKLKEKFKIGMRLDV